MSLLISDSEAICSSPSGRSLAWFDLNKEFLQVVLSEMLLRLFGILASTEEILEILVCNLSMDTALICIAF